MSSLLRALRKRLKANPPPVKPKGKLYSGTIESVSIGGRVFPVLDESEARSFTSTKPASECQTVGVLDQLRREQPAIFEPSSKRPDWVSEQLDIISDIRAAAEKMRADHLRGPQCMSHYERAQYEALRDWLLAAIPKDREKPEV